MTQPASGIEHALNATANSIAAYDRALQIRLIQTVVRGWGEHAMESVLDVARQLKPGEKAQLAQQLLLDVAHLPEQQLEATMAIESRRRPNSSD